MIVQCIYIDNIARCNRWKNSIDSVFRYADDERVLIVGYAGDYEEFVREYVRSRDFVEISLENANYGKSFNLNKLKLGNEPHVIVSDGDIILSDHICNFIDIFERSSLDILVPSYEEDDRHHKMFLTDIGMGLKLDTSNTLYGLCGGFFIARRLEKFDSVGEYGPEDTLYFYRVRKRNGKIGLTEDYKVIHPWEEDLEYKRNKSNIILRFIRNIDESIASYTN